jgi:hypothetical protein
MLRPRPCPKLIDPQWFAPRNTTRPAVIRNRGPAKEPSLTWSSRQMRAPRRRRAEPEHQRSDPWPPGLSPPDPDVSDVAEAVAVSELALRPKQSSTLTTAAFGMYQRLSRRTTFQDASGGHLRRLAWPTESTICYRESERLSIVAPSRGVDRRSATARRRRSVSADDSGLELVRGTEWPEAGRDVARDVRRKDRLKGAPRRRPPRGRQSPGASATCTASSRCSAVFGVLALGMFVSAIATSIGALGPDRRAPVLSLAVLAPTVHGLS